MESVTIPQAGTFIVIVYLPALLGAIEGMLEVLKPEEYPAGPLQL
jgi:hypothetical protein